MAQVPHDHGYVVNSTTLFHSGVSDWPAGQQKAELAHSMNKWLLGWR